MLVVYSWDLLLALLAMLGALAAFGGRASVGSRTVDVSLAEQVLAAVSSASFAAALLIVATLLTRRQRWVRRVQIALLLTAIALGLVSLAVAVVQNGRVSSTALTALLVLLVDAALVVAFTGQRAVEWYSGTDGRAPRYVVGTVVFWALSSCVLIALQAVR